MFNLKNCALVAGIAFILSLLIGLVSRSSVSMLLVRAFIFAAVFFLISGLVYLLVNHFLPELLDKDSPGGDILLPGSRIDITEGDTPPASVQAFLGAQADDSDEDLGNISDLVNRGSTVSRVSGGGSPAGMDQNPQDEYNKVEDSGDFSEAESSFPRGTSRSYGGSSEPETFQSGDAGGLAEFPGSVDILPDLDSMAGAFLPAAGDPEADTTDYSVSAPAPKSSSGGKTPAWSGDFNAKDLAAGLRTILSKEKEG